MQQKNEDVKIDGGSVGVSKRRAVAPPPGSQGAGAQVRPKAPVRPRAGGSNISETNRSRWGDVTIERDSLRILPQFRKEFDPVEIDNLASSISQLGLLMPVVVYEDPEGKGYILAAGERRIRAVDQLAAQGVRVPIRAIVRSRDDAVLIQLHENTQRVELNKLEVAASYLWLQHNDPVTREPRDEPLTVRKLAELVNKGHDTVFHYLRLASLSDSVVALMEEKIITSPRTLDNIQRLFGEGFEEIGMEVCAQCRDGNIMQRDAISRTLNLLQEGLVTPSAMLALIQTRGLTQTKTVDALKELVTDASDAVGAIEKVLDAFKASDEGSLGQCIKDALKGVDTQASSAAESVVTQKTTSSSVSHDKQNSPSSDAGLPLESPSMDTSLSDREEAPEDDETPHARRSPASTISKSADKPKAAKTSVVDAIPSGVVVSKKSGRSGVVVAVKVQWDDGEEGEVSDLDDLRLPKAK